VVVARPPWTFVRRAALSVVRSAHVCHIPRQARPRASRQRVSSSGESSAISTPLGSDSSCVRQLARGHGRRSSFVQRRRYSRLRNRRASNGAHSGAADGGSRTAQGSQPVRTSAKTLVGAVVASRTACAHMRRRRGCRGFYAAGKGAVSTPTATPPDLSVEDGGKKGEAGRSAISIIEEYTKSPPAGLGLSGFRVTWKRSRTARSHRPGSRATAGSRGIADRSAR